MEYLARVGWILIFLVMGLSFEERPLTAEEREPLSFSLLTLNLHGYHPTNEAQRFTEDKIGLIESTYSHVYYFKENEIYRGNRARLDVLANDLKRLLPDLVLLQEVGAGSPTQDKNCEIFYKNPGQDLDWVNTVWRLAYRLSGSFYSAEIACRGNIGWQTSASSFVEKRILREKHWAFETVFDFGENPYPKGIIVEGLGMLVRKPWKIFQHYLWGLKQNEYGDRFMVEAAVIKKEAKDTFPWNTEPEAPWLIVANVHAGHKVAHFEQGVVLRRALSDLKKSLLSAGLSSSDYRGTIVAGDFNSWLYRPESEPTRSEISSLPWEVSRKNEYNFAATFDDSTNHDLMKRLNSELTKLNDNNEFKPWASIQDPVQAEDRITRAVQNFFTWQKEELASSEGPPVLLDMASQARLYGKCKPVDWGNAVCARREMIDHIFVSPGANLNNFFILYNNHDFVTLNSLSDHPAVYVSLSL